MKTQLQASNDEIKEKITSLSTRADVANLLEIEDKFLCVILYGLKERRNYSKFEIQKKSRKTRVISKPPRNIAILQSKLHHALSLLYKPKKCVHGFARNRSVLSNALNHCRRRHVLNIDLKDFFPSIHIGRVKGALMKGPYNMGKEAAEVIAQICCLDSGELPQGGPTSPIVSNLVCRRLDSQLTELAKDVKCQYSRYADDITFSTFQARFPEKLARINGDEIVIGNELCTTIQDNKFETNPDKIKYVDKELRQEVTGITVNEFPNITRGFIVSISRELHTWEKFSYEFANRIYAKRLGVHESCVNLMNVLKGRIAFLKMIKGGNSPLFRRMAFRFNRLSECRIHVPDLKEIKPYPLRGGYPRREVWNVWYERYTDLIALLNVKKPDSAPVATAFDIGNDLLATAGHNLENEIEAIWFGDDRVRHTDYSNELYRSRGIDVGIVKLLTGQRINNRYLPTQCRLPQSGEEVCAIGYPVLPWRDTALVMHVGVVEALPTDYSNGNRYIQVSFQSGGGLSGSPLIDKRGFAVGIMVENIFPKPSPDVPARPFGQAVPIEYLHRYVNDVVL